MSINAYKRTISETESPRSIERRILSQVTSELEQLAAEYDQAETSVERLRLLSEGLRDILWKNERVWIAFKADLADNGNALPPALRSGLLSIAIWVENHTQGVMNGKLKVRPLIEINRSIIRGLEGNQLHLAE